VAVRTQRDFYGEKGVKPPLPLLLAPMEIIEAIVVSELDRIKKNARVGHDDAEAAARIRAEREARKKANHAKRYPNQKKG
jgi:hypothetical protein